jgi:lysophospholipase L1-like esterase
MVMSFENNPEKIVIYTIGDSTMANKVPDVYPETGWGQVLQEFFDGEIVVKNHAMNGRSTKSFIAEGRWGKVLDSLKQGDYVFIQFGHNDEKEKDTTRFTNPETGYRTNLMKFINETRSKGAIPVLLTPIVRRNFDGSGTLVDTHGAYPEVMRSVAGELKVTLIDLQRMTSDMVIQSGVEGSKELFVHVKPGENKHFPEGKEDNTHLSEKGARKVASMVASAIASLQITLSSHVNR